MSRWILFLIFVTLGLAGGLYFGWFVEPIQYEDTSPDTLRVDFKTDYVLMVAEAYQVEGDMALAMHRLMFLGDASPEESVQNAINFAISGSSPYSEADLALMRRLAQALQNRLNTGDS